MDATKVADHVRALFMALPMHRMHAVCILMLGGYAGKRANDLVRGWELDRAKVE